MTATPILQFGTSRFLQAHADLFVSEARDNGQDAGPITVVQSSGDPSRLHRLKALQAAFPVRIEGIEQGHRVQDTKLVTSITRALSTALDWDEVVRVFVQEAEIVLSNTGDTGFAARDADSGTNFDQSMSYPAKLRLLLRARFEEHGRGIQIMPVELIADNGRVLQNRVQTLAANDSAGFRRYLEQDVIWVNSLVDRIVSQPLEPAGAVAEPYALWAIEAQPNLRVPCLHPSIQVVSSLQQIEALKLFVLNLGHTVIAQHWLDNGGCSPALVRDFVATPQLNAALSRIYRDEVRPAFETAGLGAEFNAYVHTTFERFSNPFLDHRIADIAQNHAQKVERRIKAMMDFAIAQGDQSQKPTLQRIVEQNLTEAS